MLNAADALQRLREGNQRFVNDERVATADATAGLRRQLFAGQTPFAIILGCSDSRVPTELIFDQGLGDLFVIRVAGNIVAPSQIGSVEFAAAQFGSRLVVVLGHSRCGAVEATLEQLEQDADHQSPNLHSIVKRIRPAVEPLFDRGVYADDPEALMHHAVRANVHASVRDLRNGSAILERLIAEEDLRIVGAEYDLESGVVEFLDEPPTSG